MLLVGGSSVGKTRCAFEALQALLPDWWLIHPSDGAEVTALVTDPPLRTVVWLDDLQNYLGGEGSLTVTTVRSLLRAQAPIVVVGALWSDQYATWTTAPAFGMADPHQQARAVLDLADMVRIPSRFSREEQDRARAAAVGDVRIRIALHAEGYGLTQTLAAAPQLVSRWEDAGVYAKAVLTAAVDATRLGVRDPLTADLLRAAATGYCNGRERAEAPTNWFETALAYATEKLHGAVAALAPVGIDMGQISGYTVADYLLQAAIAQRRYERLPATTWEALIAHTRSLSDLTRLGYSANSRLLYCYAIPLYRCAADTGDRDAAAQLAGLLAKQHNVYELQIRADVGDEAAAGWLAELLAERGDVESLQIRADAGDEVAADRLARLSARSGGVEALQALVDTGNRYAGSRLVELLAERGDVGGLEAHVGIADEAAARLAWLLAEQGNTEGLRARADAGDRSAGRGLAWLLAEWGDAAGLRACANAGDRYAAGRLAWLLAERNDLEGIQARADAGDEAAADLLNWLLAKQLADRGDLQGLRVRADAGDRYAAGRLAWLLAERNDLEGLRALADTGDEGAADQLARLLADRGDLEALRGRADAGDWSAGRRLAWVLADRGDLDGLRGRADAGDWSAGRRLAWVLADRGDLDGLRVRVEGGDEAAAGWLTSLLAKQGRNDEAERLRQFGFNPDGSIATGPVSGDPLGPQAMAGHWSSPQYGG